MVSGPVVLVSTCLKEFKKVNAAGFNLNKANTAHEKALLALILSIMVTLAIQSDILGVSHTFLLQN